MKPQQKSERSFASVSVEDKKIEDANFQTRLDFGKEITRIIVENGKDGMENPQIKDKKSETGNDALYRDSLEMQERREIWKRESEDRLKGRFDKPKEKRRQSRSGYEADEETNQKAVNN